MKHLTTGFLFCLLFSGATSASSYYGYKEHSSSGGCQSGGNTACTSEAKYSLDPARAVLVSFDDPLRLNFDYGDLGFSSISSAYLNIWAYDDGKIRDSKREGNEYAGILEINGTDINRVSWSKEIDGVNRYLHLDVTKYLKGTALSALLGAAPVGSEDYLFSKATLEFKYCPPEASGDHAPAVPVPPAVWLFGSGWLALTGLRKKSASKLIKA